jgi:hypothetical protein
MHVFEPTLSGHLIACERRGRVRRASRSVHLAGSPEIAPLRRLDSWAFVDKCASTVRCYSIPTNKLPDTRSRRDLFRAVGHHSITSRIYFCLGRSLPSHLLYTRLGLGECLLTPSLPGLACCRGSRVSLSPFLDLFLPLLLATTTCAD